MRPSIQKLGSNTIYLQVTRLLFVSELIRKLTHIISKMDKRFGCHCRFCMTSQQQADGRASKKTAIFRNYLQ